MKIRILTFLILMLHISVYGQVIKSSKDFKPDELIIRQSANLIIKIDSTHFLFLQKDGKDEAALIKYNDKLEEVFRIKLQNQFRSYEYFKDANYIVNFVREKTKRKGGYSIEAELYNASNGNKINQKPLITNSEYYYGTYFSDSKNFFCLCHTPDNEKKEPYVFKMYNTIDLSELYEIEIQLNKNEDFIANETTDSGALIITTNNAKTKQITLRVFNKNGKEVINETRPHSFSENVWYIMQNMLIINKNEIGLLFRVISKKGLEGIEEWIINMESNTVKKNYELEFTQEFCSNNIYQNTYGNAKSKNLIEKKQQKAPLKLINFSVSEIYGLKNGDILFILDRMYHRELSGSTVEYSKEYIGKEVILLNIDQKGRINWGNVIDREIAYSTSGQNRSYIPKYTGIHTLSHVDDNTLNMLNWEMLGKNEYIVIYRKFNINTGEIVDAKSLDDIKLENISSVFAEWLTHNKIALLNMKGIHFFGSSKDLKLQIIQLD